MASQNSDLATNDWKRFYPLVHKAVQIRDVFPAFRDQDERLNKLEQRAAAAATFPYPWWQMEGRAMDKEEPQKIRSTANELRTKLRAVPRAMCQEAREVLNKLQTVPKSLAESLKREIDDRYIEKSCRRILEARKVLRRFAGPPPEDCMAPTDETAVLVDEAVIDAIEARLNPIEERQRETTQMEEQRFLAQQEQAKELQERQKAEKTQTQPAETVKEAKPTYKPKGIYNDLAFTNATKTMKKDPRFRIEIDVGTMLSDTGLGDVLANVKKSINRQTKAETGRELLPRDWDKRKNSIVRSLKRGGLLPHTQSPEKKV